MYTDEKYPEGELVEIYEVVPIVEADQPRPARPLWRRLLRVFITFLGISMLWSAFAPIHHCHRKPNHNVGHRLPVNGMPGTLDKPKLHYKFGAIKDFEVEQGSLSVLPSLVDVFGKVVLGSNKKAEGIEVTFDINVSDDGLWEKIKIEPRNNGIYFAANAVVLTRQSVNITAFVVVPEGKEHIMKSFVVKTTGLNIQLLESFNTMVNASYLETVSGNITSYGGPKDILLAPFLAAKSVSGNIYGRFGLGKGLKLETASGHIKANISSAPFHEVKAKLKTVTVSGNNTVFFATQLNERPLYSTHSSVSGPVYIDYPEEWQGKLKATSVSGDIRVLGKGTKIVKKEKGIKGRLVKAIKGDGKSRASLNSVSGDIAIGVGSYDWRNPNQGDGTGDDE